MSSGLRKGRISNWLQHARVYPGRSRKAKLDHNGERIVVYASCKQLWRRHWEVKLWDDMDYAELEELFGVFKD
jgi:hypothetical protein